MSNEKQTIKSDDLIAIANSQLQEHEDFIEGIKVTSVAEQRRRYYF
ncbi:DUF2498 family protein [Psychromonas sp. KJ10-10]